MPSSPLPVRPVLAALLTALLMASSVLVGASASPLPSAAAADAAGMDAPAAPPETDPAAPVSMDLVSLTPTSLAPGGTLTAEVEVTNTSSEPLSAVALQLRTRTARVTDREKLETWQSDTSPDTSGAALATSAEVDEIAPGKSATVTVEVDAEELDYSEAPYFWGTRRISLTAVSGEEPLSALRSFVVWRPEEATASITQSVLLPVSAPDPAAAITDPQALQESLDAGHLADQQQLALRDDVDWWLDPALLDPPLLPVDTEEGSGEDAQDEESAQVPREYAPDPRSEELATTLQEGVGDRTVLAMPFGRADLVSLNAGGAEDLAAVAAEKGRATWEDSGISPRATALGVPGPTASGDTLDGLIDVGASAALVPSAAVQPDLHPSVTPSSVGMYESSDDSGDQLPLLTPDPVLSDEFSHLTAEADTEQTRQRLLAETATIASEYATAPRHLLISPDPEAALDPAAAGATLDALEEAPWVSSGRTGDLLDAAAGQETTTDPRAEGDEIYAQGRLGGGDVLPAARTEDGGWEHPETAADPDLLDPEVLSSLEDTWGRLGTLATVMEDDSSLEPARREMLGAVSVRWRGHPEIPAQRAEASAARAEALESRIEVVPASGYNLISDSVGVPITISNGLDTPITVHTEVSSDRPLVQIGEHGAVEVPARGQVDATVPVDAVANGTVTLTTVLTTEDGTALTEPVQVPLTVNPAWENWTTLVLVIAMGVLVVVGVARARRTGASTRAPAVHGPEDPEELARTGRSTPAPFPTSTDSTDDAEAAGDTDDAAREERERIPPADAGSPPVDDPRPDDPHSDTTADRPEEDRP
ncbi:DUF6049 family protein [Brachybacterium fresconis]|uniref:Uncharacterized protein n=1 Tax=Brachybacterium fresconis TaxID=173363 RepID=A0ABS4YLC3_9MICO|nr:DUF6049 family protein [Brachybacterium fresconis]MBP2409599.1 hypothetical protein [Brachybacterium fresconis]